MDRRQKGAMPIGYFSLYQETKRFPRNPIQLIFAWISLVYSWSKGTISPWLSYTNHNHPLGISSSLRDLQYKQNKVEFSYRIQEESEQCQVHTFSSVPHSFHTLYLWFLCLTLCPRYLQICWNKLYINFYGPSI